MTHYTYKIKDPVTEEYYIGSRSCKGKPENDSYMGSYCTWDPDDESRLVKEILGIYPTRALTNSVERKLQILALKVYKDPKCMNAHISRIGFCNFGKEFSDEHKRKISKSKKGSYTLEWFIEKHGEKLGTDLYNERCNRIRESMIAENNHNFNRTFSEETKRKISENNVGMLGKSHTEETKRKMRKPKSEEHSRKIGEVKKKQVLQFTTDGEFIKEWESITKASNKLNINQGNISSACSGRYKSAGGFIWRYKNI